MSGPLLVPSSAEHRRACRSSRPVRRPTRSPARTVRTATAWFGGSPDPTIGAVSRPRDGAGPLGRWARPPIASRTRSGSPDADLLRIGADEHARLGAPSRVPGQHPAHRHGLAVRAPQRRCRSRHRPARSSLPSFGPPSRNGHAHPLGRLPCRPGPWRQLAGADNARPALLSFLARRRWIEEARVHPAASHAHHALPQRPEKLQAGESAVPHHHQPSARSTSGRPAASPRRPSPAPSDVAAASWHWPVPNGSALSGTATPRCALAKPGRATHLQRQPAQTLDLDEEAAA